MLFGELNMSVLFVRVRIVMAKGAYRMVFVLGVEEITSKGNVLLIGTEFWQTKVAIIVSICFVVKITNLIIQIKVGGVLFEGD
jgi:hypothetical protein